MQGLYGYIPLNGGRTRTLPDSESLRARINLYTLFKPKTILMVEYSCL